MSIFIQLNLRNVLYVITLHIGLVGFKAQKTPPAAQVEILATPPRVSIFYSGVPSHTHSPPRHCQGYYIADMEMCAGWGII